MLNKHPVIDDIQKSPCLHYTTSGTQRRVTNIECQEVATLNTKGH